MSGLAKQSLQGGIFFLVSMTAMILLPAGTNNYWQAWLYLSVFAISCLLITLYLLKYDTKLLESRLHVGASAEIKKEQKVIQGFASLFLLLIFVTSGFDHRFGWSSISSVASIAADIVVAVSFFIIFQVFRENTFTDATVKVSKNQKVIQIGWYSLVRHPMYFGAMILFFATPIALGSYWALIFSVVLTVTMIIRLIEEEKYLLVNLKGYKEYTHKVKKHLVPFVW
jgi:protein-S-isoprenylcysteine O-methyltransferase Ste14